MEYDIERKIKCVCSISAGEWGSMTTLKYNEKFTIDFPKYAKTIWDSSHNYKISRRKYILYITFEVLIMGVLYISPC